MLTAKSLQMPYWVFALISAAVPFCPAEIGVGKGLVLLGALGLALWSSSAVLVDSLQLVRLRGTVFEGVVLATWGISRKEADQMWAWPWGIRVDCVRLVPAAVMYFSIHGVSHHWTLAGAAIVLVEVCLPQSKYLILWLRRRVCWIDVFRYCWGSLGNRKWLTFSKMLPHALVCPDASRRYVDVRFWLLASAVHQKIHIRAKSYVVSFVFLFQSHVAWMDDPLMYFLLLGSAVLFSGVGPWNLTYVYEAI